MEELFLIVGSVVDHGVTKGTELLGITVSKGDAREKIRNTPYDTTWYCSDMRILKVKCEEIER